MSAVSDPLGYLSEELAALERAGRLRVRAPARERLVVPGRVNLCSNDYLGYVASGRLAEAVRRAAEQSDPGSGASRLVFGERVAHRNLERSIAGWLGTEDSIVFSSGYAANVGTIAALVQPGDVLVSDALNHASIIDGCRLSKADVVVVRHGDVEAIRGALRASTARRRWVVTESYFSMDGDGPDVRAVRAACDEFGAALILDEAHAFGVFGREGRGRAGESSVVPDVWIGTLGKAFGASGAFVAGREVLCGWLWNRARSFVFSTGASPWICSVAESAIRMARSDEAARARLRAVAERLRLGLRALGVVVAEGFGPIVPVMLGDDRVASEWASRLGARGVDVQAIRPPTVPEGSARLRITANAALSDEEVSRVLESVEAVQREVAGR